MLSVLQPLSAAAADPYGAWVACSHSKQAPKSHTCSKGSAKGAFFKSDDASVQYKICVRYPAGQKLCATHQSAPKGKVRLNTITSGRIGEHRVTWSVGGEQVRAWTFEVT
jgi:hypothetical protein